MDKMRKGPSGKEGKMKKSGAYVVVVDESKPTPDELVRMKQQERERKMDEGTARGVAPYEREMEVRGYKKGGSVSRGNGCAIRGTKKCKMY
jgi:hypothetical protein